MRNFFLFCLGTVVFLAAENGVAYSLPERAEKTTFTAIAELGALGVGYNKVQFGRHGTPIDLRNEAGQKNLYFNTRWALDLELGWRHHLIALYQPLEINTVETLDRQLAVEQTIFPRNSVVDFTYGFPFYRASYLYDLIDARTTRFSIGGSLQIRNANITFRAADSSVFRAQRDIGLVPLLKMVWERKLSAWWFGTEFDGIYAPVSYLNGSDNEVRGALVDWNWRVGIPLQSFADTYLFLRYLGGGAKGETDTNFSENWLHTGVVGIGFRLQAR